MSGGEHHHGAARKSVRQAVRAGNIASAVNVVRETFPSLLDSALGLPARVNLHCQAFIERVWHRACFSCHPPKTAACYIVPLQQGL